MKLGIIGLGTVGEGVLEILTKEKNALNKKGVEVEVKYACDLNIDRNFSFEFDKNILVTDFNTILEDSEIDMVVELIGGESIAKTIIVEAIKKGKNIVTANKALIAKHAEEIFALAAENKVHIYYEASVGGGIPIITPLQEDLVANNIKSVRGIINGTANYILTEMKDKNLDFDIVLKDAMDKGYAEADPTYDIEGIDTAHKICILASLAFNKKINFEDIIIAGITKVKPIDIKFGKEMGYNIKLIASAYDRGDKVEVKVQPTFVDTSSLISNVHGVFNAIEVESDYVGQSLFYGRGAGKEATASAIVADIAKIAIDSPTKERYYFNLKDKAVLVEENELKGTYYIRLEKKYMNDALDNLASKIFEKEEYYIAVIENKTMTEVKSVLGNAEYTKFDIN
jgi:homoserine dehydrogenase